MPLLITCPTIATATALATAPAPETQWLLPANLFRLLVVGSIIGLVMATLVIVLIWLKELRQGKVW
jgi:hypothetical protein